MIISYLKKISIVGLCIWLLTNLIDQSVDISRLLDKHKYSYHSSLKFIKHIDSYFNENVSILSLNMMQEFAYFANGNYDAEIYYDYEHFKESCTNNVNKKYAIGSYDKPMGYICGVQLCQNDSMSFKFNKKIQFKDMSVDIDTGDSDNIYFEFEQEELLVSKLSYTMLKSMSKGEKEHIRFNSVKITNSGSEIASIMKFTNAIDEISKWPVNVDYSVNFLFRANDHGWIVYASEYLLGRKRPIPDGEPSVFDTHSILAGATEMKANIIINDGTNYLAEIVETSPLPKL